MQYLYSLKLLRYMFSTIKIYVGTRYWQLPPLYPLSNRKRSIMKALIRWQLYTFSCVDYSICLRWGHSSVETKDRFLSPWLNGDVLFSIVFNQNAGTDKSVFPLPEPQDVFLAAQVKFDDLSRDLRQLGRDLTSTWCLYCNLYLFQLLLSKHSRKHPSRVMNENTVRDIGWLHISSALSRQAVIISIHVDWMSGIVSLWSFCCVFLLENLSQSV